MIEEELNRPLGTVDAYLIDEIGKMECHGPQFIDGVCRSLEGPVPVVATIALRVGGFIAEVKKRPNVQIVEVTRGNRQALPRQIAAWVKQYTAQANTR
jgi:nucleoside-triphosphatase